MTQKLYLERFQQVTNYLNALTNKKNSDYAGEGNAFQNFNLIEILTSGRVSTSAGILVRMTDKLQRIANLLAKPPHVVEEAIEDSLLDLAVYSIIEFLWLTSGKATLPLPGAVTEVTPQADAPAPVDNETPLPEGASPNTMEEAFNLLSGKVLREEILTPWESLMLKAIIATKERLLDEEKVS